MRRTRRKIKEKIVELAPLGKELSQLIHYKDEYRQGYKKLRDNINRHLRSIGIARQKSQIKCSDIDLRQWVGKIMR